MKPFPHLTDTNDPWLLTPGPLTTSLSVKQAMLRDWGSRDPDFIAMIARIRSQLVALAKGGDAYTAIPVQGSGTYAVEAMLSTLVPRGGKLLILVNGAYGKRATQICDYAGRSYAVYETAEDTPPEPDAIAAILAADPGISHVFAVHCETTTGILNPIREIAAVTAKAGRRLLVDSMSAFGALPIDAETVPFDALAASSNKCLEGVPGLGFVIVRKTALKEAAGNAVSLSLDLAEQVKALDAGGQFRFTPPVQVLAAFDQAISEHAAEGGVAGRGARYTANRDRLIAGMRTLGFATLLPDELQAPIIVTFRMPADPAFRFTEFYDRLKAMGYVIYPGKLTVAESFRMGCIGRLGAPEIDGALAAVAEALKAMGVTNPAP